MDTVGEQKRTRTAAGRATTRSRARVGEAIVSAAGTHVKLYGTCTVPLFTDDSGALDLSTAANSIVNTEAVVNALMLLVIGMLGMCASAASDDLLDNCTRVDVGNRTVRECTTDLIVLYVCRLAPGLV